MFIIIKKLLILLFITVFTISAYSQIKDSIIIVKPKLSQKIVNAYNKKAKELEKDGQKKLSDSYRSLVESGFGSGFVVFDENGDQFIITNRHVVEFAESVSITIENDLGETKEITDLEIVYIDRELDLALIKSPNNEFKNGLTLAEIALKDGDQVWAAGYPGLLGEPAWQFSLGTITNKRASIPTISAKDLSYLIQHSATIDAGNSGGPLLVKDESEPLGFSVIGINTWSISNRNNTYFSIPSSTIKLFLIRALEVYRGKKDSETLTSTLRKAAEIFQGEFSKEKPNQLLISSFISPNLIGTDGLDSYYNVLDSSSISLRNKWRDSFHNSPERTMRGAIYDRLINNYKSDDISEQITISNINQEKLSAEIKLVLNKKSVKSSWIFDNGLWQLEDINLGKSIKEKDSIVDNNSGISPAYMNLLLPGYTQFQRKDITGLTYATLAVTGVAYFILGVSDTIDFTETIDGSNPNTSMALAGLGLYIGSGLVSYLKELITN